MKKVSVLMLFLGAVLTSCASGSAGVSSSSVHSSATTDASGSPGVENSTVASQPEIQGNDITSVDKLLGALASEGLECKGFGPPKPEEELLHLNADSQGTCLLGTHELHLAIWKSESAKNKEMKRFLDSVCQVAKAFGITTVDYVDGGVWEIDNVPTEQLKVIAESLAAEYKSVPC